MQKERRLNIKGRLVLFLIAVCMLVSCSAFTLRASAEGVGEITRAPQTQSISPTLRAVPSRSVGSYASYPITLYGKTLSDRALLIGGTLYIPMDGISESVGARIRYNSATKELVVTANGLYLSVKDGAYVTYVNDRPFFTGYNSAVMNNGKMYVHIDTVMKAFGLSYKRGASGAVAVSGSFSPPPHASKFYRDDEVLWLSRIISAESRGEPLLGQIAVGSVVLNRVASSQYPNTIYSVIFDRRYGVQFSPIIDGSIYNTPTYNCVLAAKICLEGVRVGEGALFFLRPSTSSSLWIPTTRKFLYSIGNHDFYA